jgi:mono/diheme cytochrome c family protein
MPSTRPLLWVAMARIPLATILITLLVSSVATHGQSTRAERSGRDLYLAACAACHGADGRGASRERVGFDTALPDFTDCRFATPEPDQDWTAVIHEGGPARAFDRRMPAFGAALTAAEIARIVEHLRTLCADGSWPRGELNLPRALFTEKAFPENEAVLTVAASTSGPGILEHTLVYERRLGARAQVEVTAPFAAASDGNRWTSGFGDVAIGAKRVLAHSLARGALLSAGGELVLPTGESGLGGGVTRFEPFLAFGQILPGDGFLQVQSGVELSARRARAPHEVFWRIAAGRSLSAQRFGRTWSPMIELLGARELVAGGRVEWDLAPQMQVTLSRRQHIVASGGVRVPISQRDGRYPQIAFHVLWDWFDGGLGSGW